MQTHTHGKWMISIIIVLMSLFSSAGMSKASDDDVVNAVVNISVSKVRAWDNGYNSAGVGTGFVIDAQQGLILTNKHIVQTGPVVAYAEFANKQQLPLVPVYRDPVHDFGVFRYDPAALTMTVNAITLSNHASVGTPIRLYGNDSGENLSIIQGVLSRIDREAPAIRSTDADFNTFYFQAALGTSGGSSGSPILNPDNQAIAINAAGRNDTETAFFLPMEMVLPTVKKLIAGQSVTRGTLQTVFNHVPYPRLATLGVSAERLDQWQQQQGASGKLMVAHVLPKGVADGKLFPGDILISLNQQSVDDFRQLENSLNQKVGQTLTLQVLRNGQDQAVQLSVADLFALMPSEFIEFGEAVMIPVGIGLSRLFNIPAEGVTLVNPGPVFGSQNIGRYALIEELNGKQINQLSDVLAVLADVPADGRFSVRYRYPQNIRDQRYKMITAHGKWFTNQHCMRRDEQVHWFCQQIAFAQAKPEQRAARNQPDVTSAIVDISVFRPIKVNNQSDVSRHGQGAVVDVNSGLILADRALLDSSLAQVGVTFNNGQSVSARVVAIHPYLNMAMLQADLSDIAFKRKVLPKLASISPNVNQTYGFIGKSEMEDFQVDVKAIWPELMPNGALHDSVMFEPLPPYFGLFLDDKHRITAVNTQYYRNKEWHLDVIPGELVKDFVDAVRGQQQGLYIIESQFDYTSYTEASELGIDNLGLPYRNRHLSVKSVESLRQQALQPGDIVLEVDQQAMLSLNQLYMAIDKDQSEMAVLRNGERHTITTDNQLRKFNPFTDVVNWAGSVIHEIRHNIYLPEGVAEQCMAISIYYYGGPVHSANIPGSSCIYTIDGERVFNAADILRLIGNKKSGDYTKVQVVELGNNFRISEFRLQEEPVYWPVTHWALQQQQWQQQALE